MIRDVVGGTEAGEGRDTGAEEDEVAALGAPAATVFPLLKPAGRVMPFLLAQVTGSSPWFLSSGSEKRWILRERLERVGSCRW